MHETNIAKIPIMQNESRIKAPFFKYYIGSVFNKLEFGVLGSWENEL